MLDIEQNSFDLKAYEAKSRVRRYLGRNAETEDYRRNDRLSISVLDA